MNVCFKVEGGFRNSALALGRSQSHGFLKIIGLKMIRIITTAIIIMCMMGEKK